MPFKHTGHLIRIIVFWFISVAILPVMGETFIVTRTDDEGEGSLRWAIDQANAHTGLDTIQFNIPADDPGFDGSVWTIRPQTMLPTLVDDGTFIEGISQERSQGDHNPEGPDIVLDGRDVDTDAIGLVISSANNVVYRLVISGFKDFGIRIRGVQAQDNHIIGNYIGTNASASDTLGNGSGIYISRDASHTTIGGADPWMRNVISGNYQDGIYITESEKNIIIGNFIGTDRTGTESIPNGRDGKHSGIHLGSGSAFTVVGGEEEGQKNVISGNFRDGIHIAGSTDNHVIGNYIGTDVTGTVNIGNGLCGLGDGIDIRSGSKNNRIGSKEASERNVVCGNPNMGIRIFGEGTRANVVQGNLIGTDASGTQAFGNNDYGVYIYEGSTFNVIGGTQTGETNIVSGNAVHGVCISGAGTDSNQVMGNFIGTDYNGADRLENEGDGITVIFGAKHSQIGPNNLIGGNGGNGILISGADTDSNCVLGNWIGLNITGLDTIPNDDYGIRIDQGSSHNTIGGPNTEDRNVISGNGLSGIRTSDDSSGYNLFQNNFLGTNIDGTSPLGNRDDGVQISSSFNVFRDNLLSGNEGCGIVMNGYSEGNRLYGNKIGVQADGISELPNTESGIRFDFLAHTVRDTIGPNNTIWYNHGYGVELRDSTSSRITITQNSIAFNDSSAIKLKNGANGRIDAPSITGVCPLTGTAIPYSTVEIFSDPSDQGATYEGAVIVDGDGHWVFDGNLIGPCITATTTDTNGNTSELSPSYSLTGLEPEQTSPIPDAFQLYQNHPNPFNPKTTIAFAVSRSCRVQLSVFNLLGQRVLDLVDGRYEPGQYRTVFDGSGLASGVYIYTVQMGNDFRAIKRMVLLE